MATKDQEKVPADRAEKIRERIRLAVEARGVTPHKFAKLCGISYAALREYIGGTRLPGVKAVIAILRESAVSPDWLLLGRGPMLANQDPEMGDVDEALFGYIAREVALYQYRDSEDRIKDEEGGDEAYMQMRSILKKTLKKTSSNAVLAAGVYNRVSKITNREERVDAIKKEIKSLVRLSQSIVDAEEGF